MKPQEFLNEIAENWPRRTTEIRKCKCGSYEAVFEFNGIKTLNGHWNNKYKSCEASYIDSKEVK